MPNGHILPAWYFIGKQPAGHPQGEQAGYWVENHDLKGIISAVCTNHIYLEEEEKSVRQPQRRLNPHIQEVVCAEVLKLLQAGIIYPISDST